MKYFLETLHMFSILIVFSGIIISSLLIGTLDFLRNRHKVIIVFFLFVILYLALIELNGIFSNLML